MRAIRILRVNVATLPVDHFSASGCRKASSSGGQTMRCESTSTSFPMILDDRPRYNPLILPATLSTASLSWCASRTTLSLSSSAHSAMNVAVSPTNPTRASNSVELPDAWKVVTYRQVCRLLLSTSPSRTLTPECVPVRPRNGCA